MRKSSAENTHGRRVEDVFRDGFENAESTPPARIWENIDRALENQELQHYKGQIFWYRSMAAACFLLLIAGGAFFWSKNQTGKLLVGQENAIAEQKTSTSSQFPSQVDVDASKQVKAGRVIKEQQADFGLFSQNQPKSVKTESVLDKAYKTGVATQEPSKFRLASNLPQRRNSKRVLQDQVSQEETASNDLSAGANSIEYSTSSANSEQNAVAYGSETKKFDRSALAATGVLKNDSSVQRSATILALAQKKEEKLAQQAPVSPKVEQDEITKSAIKGWSLSAAYASQYAQAPIKLQAQQPGAIETMRASIAQERTNQAYQEAIEEYNQSYSPAYSYAAQVGASYRLNEHWQVESGLLYTQNQSTTTHSYIINGTNGNLEASFMAKDGFNSSKAEPLLVAALTPKSSDVQNLNGPSFMSSSSVASVIPTEKYRTIYKFQQVGVPVRVAYRHNFKKAYAFVSGGMNINLLLESSINPESNQVQAQTYKFNQEDSPFRNVQWAAVTSLGIGYEMNTRLTLSLAPELTYSFSSYVKEAKSQPDPYQLGLSLGGKWRLSR